MTHQDDHNDGTWAPASSPVALESLRITLDLYRNGKSGVPYAKLQQFIRPILAHYQIELGVDFNDEVTADNLDDITLLLDVLETATIFWEYCALSDAEKQASIQDLQNNLLGPAAAREEMAQFTLLIASMEAHWEQLNDGECMAGGQPAPVSPDFETGSPGSVEDPSGSYGTEKLDIPEAFALFSRPMLDNEAIYEDPEALDDVMSRAQAYWDLAHLPAQGRDQHFERICRQYCNGNTTKEQIMNEALLMIQRFHELFPERK